MKTKLFVACLAILLSQTAIAQANPPFGVQASCSFNQARGECVILNSWNRPIYCQISIRGLVRSGAWFKGNQAVTVMPNQTAYAEVFALNPQYDPLVDTRGGANCRFWTDTPQVSGNPGGFFMA